MEECTPILFWHVFSMTLSPILWRNSELQYDVLYWFPIMTTALVPLRLGLGCADCSSSLMPSVERCLSWHSLPVLEVFHSLKIHRAPPLFAGGERLHRDSCHTHTQTPVLHHVSQSSRFNGRQGVSSHRQLTTLFYHWVKTGQLECSLSWASS